jgi:hypothetical protein
MAGLHVRTSHVPDSDIAAAASHQGVEQAVETVLRLPRAGEVKCSAVQVYALGLRGYFLFGQLLRPGAGAQHGGKEREENYPIHFS